MLLISVICFHVLEVKSRISILPSEAPTHNCFFNESYPNADISELSNPLLVLYIETESLSSFIIKPPLVPIHIDFIDGINKATFVEYSDVSIVHFDTSIV